jgi:nucleotide-binding universal stress UspA family protein
VSFASWLRRAGAEHEVIGVHVLEEEFLLDVLRREHLEAVEKEVKFRASKVLENTGLQFGDDSVKLGSSAPFILSQEAHRLGADALILGRQARTDDQRWIRLGKVARKLVRELPCPLVIVPPEFERMPPGPVMLATDLGPESESAADFARRVAQSTRRPLTVAHVVSSYDDGGAFIPAATLQQFYNQLGLERERDLEGWANAQGLGDAPRAVGIGDPVTRLIGMAAQESAALIVVGSRRLSTVERVFSASVGTDLARHASCPVAIVPPPELD